jgi:hypothetical protein
LRSPTTSTPRRSSTSSASPRVRRLLRDIHTLDPDVAFDVERLYLHTPSRCA